MRTARSLGFAKITRDITERKQAARSAACAKRGAVSAAGPGRHRLRDLHAVARGQVTNWNAGAERIKGYTHDEIVGKHFSCFYTEEDRDRRPARTALASRRRKAALSAKAGASARTVPRFWAHVVIDPIRNELGELVGFAKVTRDVTEKRRQMEDLERAKRSPVPVPEDWRRSAS